MLLIYGSAGYTGRLVVAEALARGLRPRLAARSEPAVRGQATALGLEWKAARLDQPSELDAALAGVSVVLHCAGPFVRTWRAMYEACLRNKVHYLDITGEIAVFEALARCSDEAKRTGIMLLPGVGFDVVPTDCLAAHLARRLPGASHLRLAFHAGGGISRGTMLTMIENLGSPGAIRKGGRIESVPAAWKTRRLDFGDGRHRSVTTIPWGDVSTAFYSTGIPNVEVYTSMPAAVRRMAKASRWLGPILRTSAVRGLLEKRVRSGKPGPDDEQRQRNSSLIWGDAKTADGRRVESRMKAGSGYTLTAQTSVHIALKALGGDVKTGFQTPSLAYGPDLIMEIPGVARDDAPSSA
jgi:short subunit dehydrogenase-like uncharacterized protein